ncbi:MAG: hypothetical protein ACHQW9_01300 [Nitrososphaerales archaeon]
MNISFPPLTSGLTIINTIGLPDYTPLDSISGIAVIPAIVADTDAMSGQVIVIPLGKIIPGQEMIISVDDSLIPTYGGLKEISLQPASSAVPIGNPDPDEWMTAEVDNKIPSSITSSGLEGTPILFLNIQYPFEQSGVGFNWGNPATFAKPPTLTLVVYKTDLDYIQKDAVGCPIVDAHTLISDSWISNGLGEISSESVSSTKCHIKIQTQHFSKFAFSLRHIGSIQSSGPGAFGLGAVTTDARLNLLVVPDKAKTSSLATIQATNAKIEQSRTNTKPTEGFGNIACSRGFGYALMVGEYTGGSVPYSVIFLKMTLFDSSGRVLNTGSGTISDVDPHKTKLFNALSRYHAEFDSCSIQISNAIAK